MDPIRKEYIRRFKTEKAIRLTFEQQPRSVFSPSDLDKLIDQNRAAWDLSLSARAPNVIKRLLKNKILIKHEIAYGEEEKQVRYSYGETSAFDLAVSINPKAYLSHYSAAAMLGLTTQSPKTIYTTVEESLRMGSSDADLEQRAIDHAFAQPQRRAGTIARVGEYTLIWLTGKFTNRAGVLSAEKVPHTGIERTLIDIVVRPAYSGGAFMILEMYQQAIAQGTSGSKVTNWLEKFRYISPYHQSIGFLLREKAGYTGPALATLVEAALPKGI